MMAVFHLEMPGSSGIHKTRTLVLTMLNGIKPVLLLISPVLFLQWQSKMSAVRAPLTARSVPDQTSKLWFWSILITQIVRTRRFSCASLTLNAHMAGLDTVCTTLTQYKQVSNNFPRFIHLFAELECQLSLYSFSSENKHVFWHSVIHASEFKLKSQTQLFKDN